MSLPVIVIVIVIVICLMGKGAVAAQARTDNSSVPAFMCCILFYL